MNAKFQICSMRCIVIILAWSQNVAEVMSNGNVNKEKHELNDRMYELCAKNRTEGSGYLSLLLERGICLKPGYTNEFGRTKYFTVNISDFKVVEIDESKKSVVVNVEYSVRWPDNGIVVKKIIRIDLDPKHLWYPNFYFRNVLNSNPAEDPLVPGMVKLSPNYESAEDSILIQIRVERRVTILCNKFSYCGYPLDKQHCDFRLGLRGCSGHERIRFEYHPKRNPTTYSSAGFNIGFNRIQQKKHKDGSISVGININMNRTLESIFFKHYFPCIAIVFISQISFIVPTLNPGRIALIVTNFLTLTNIFISGMVRIIYDEPSM